jgi:AraC-like DNA-binding protein
MIQTIPFDNDIYILGISADTVTDLRGRRDYEELTNPHRVEFYALILVTEGNGFHYIDNKLFHCRPGTMLVLSPHQVHYWESSFSWQGYIVTFQDSEVFPIDNLDANYAITKAIRSVDVMTEMLDLVGREFKMLYDEYHQVNDVVSSHVQRNLLQNIMYKAFYRNNFATKQVTVSRDQQDYQRFNDAVEHYYNQRHNVSDYVDELRTSPKRLNSVCKKVKGIPAKQVIDARVLLESKRLIGYTSKPISEIAISLGFNEPTNLAKFFRRHTNISPTEFRHMSKFFSDHN